MSTIVTRAAKGSALTHNEVDANFVNLNTDKIQSGNTVAALTITSATINGGAINGTTVGATTPAAGTFTSLSDSGNLAFTGTGNRITGDFSNATLANRVLFQTTTANGNTSVGAVPNGTSDTANFNVFGSPDPTNAAIGQMAVVGATDVRFQATIAGTGTYLPMTFYTGGAERMRIATNGDLSFNSGYGSVATAYGCRAWVNFNGTGTVAIRASGNVSSITDNGTGDYTVNFTTAMPDANYAVTTAKGQAGNFIVGVMGETTAPTASEFRVNSRANDGTYTDLTYMYFSVFR